MRKIKELGQIAEGTILCTIDVVGLYSNIPLDECLVFLKGFLDSRADKQVTTDTLIELAELVLKNNIFEFSDKTYKQIRGTALVQSSLHHSSTFYGSFRGKDFK